MKFWLLKNIILLLYISTLFSSCGEECSISQFHYEWIDIIDCSNTYDNAIIKSEADVANLQIAKTPINTFNQHFFSGTAEAQIQIYDDNDNWPEIANQWVTGYFIDRLYP